MGRMIAALFVFCAFVCCYAADGAVGGRIIDAVGGVLGDSDEAVAIYTVILGIIGIGLRMLLKRVPTAMQGIVGTILWKIAAALFGDGVVLENHKDPEYVKEQLRKKYPLLQIDIKNLGK